MNAHLEKHFEKIGAKLKIVEVAAPSVRNIRFGRLIEAGREVKPVEIDIVNEAGSEVFEIRLRANIQDNLDLSVLEVKAKDRHLVLLAREVDSQGNAVNKEHFLCGHDERHLFVASVAGVSTVDQAKESLKPRLITRQEVGMKPKKRNRRKTKHFKRQGEWFFIPSSIEPDEKLVIRSEPLSRGAGSKPHMAQFCYRSGGEVVKVCSLYPNGVTLAQYRNLIKSRPKLKHQAWVDMRRNAAVYVKGKIRHADHATITLNQWHMVLMNTEQRSESVAFLD